MTLIASSIIIIVWRAKCNKKAVESLPQLALSDRQGPFPGPKIIFFFMHISWF